MLSTAIPRQRVDLDHHDRLRLPRSWTRLLNIDHIDRNVLQTSTHTMLVAGWLMHMFGNMMAFSYTHTTYQDISLIYTAGGFVPEAKV